MVSASNSRSHRYEPNKWMLKSNVRSLRGADERQRTEGEPMTGDEVFAAMKRMGVPMIDLRVN